MAILQPIIDLAAVCYGHGVRHVVISPGSRSAAMTLAFARHGGFQTHVFMDERSAGFVAIGIAQQTRIPVVLICTSGSAAYNFAPAVSEAFFQQIPLIVLTADRPKEWLHQYDGQTIYQQEIYGRHVRKSFELPADYGHQDSLWAINRIVNEALITASAKPFGPVHINIPIREPFYPQVTDLFLPSADIKIIARQETEPSLSEVAWRDILDEWDDSKKILIAIGQNAPDDQLSGVLEKISDEWNVPVLGDCISNLKGSKIIRSHDVFLSGSEAGDLRPDLLVTAGLSFISKDLKAFLRKNPALRHWHIGIDSVLPDPIQSLTRIIPVDPLYFFENMFEKIDYQLFVENTDPDNDSDFGELWSKREWAASRYKQNYIDNLTTLNDLTSISTIFKYPNLNFQIHVANSMSVRYLNMLGLSDGFSGIFSNRGTSGIDGCVSTAVGAAMVNNQPTILIIGDVAFLYDRNGLLSRSLPDNLKIVVLNNAGGNIFRMIDGPSGLPELEEFFETRHTYSAKRTCEDSGLLYFSVNRLGDLSDTVGQFLATNKISLLEIFTDPYENERVWKELRRQARQLTF